MEWDPPLKTYGRVPPPRKAHTLTHVPTTSNLVLFGGEDADGNLSNDMYIFTIASSTWQRVVYADGPHPEPRFRHTTTAISSSTLVVIGGETAQTRIENSVMPPALDAWTFDLRTCVWTRVAQKDRAFVPTWRSGHSAVHIIMLGQIPSVYIFGGFGEHDGNATVHRLRVIDWQWETVRIVVTYPDGSKHTVIDPYQDTYDMLPHTNHLHADPIAPCPRDSHAALFVPELKGMLVVGGECDEMFLNDVWLFTPTGGRGKPWKWRRLNIRMAANFTENSLPFASNATVVMLPSSRPMLLVWTGMTESDRLHGLEQAHVVDLTALQSVRIHVKNAPKHTGRAMHAFVRYTDRLYLSGGIDTSEAMPSELQRVSLHPSYRAVCSQAIDFGQVASRVARGHSIEKSSSDDENNDCNEQDARKKRLKPFSGGGIVPTGTLLTGKVTHSSQFGTHVSVVICGRVHEGVMIAYPVNGDIKVGDEDVDQEALKLLEESENRNVTEKKVEAANPPDAMDIVPKDVPNEPASKEQQGATEKENVKEKQNENEQEVEENASEKKEVKDARPQAAAVPPAPPAPPAPAPAQPAPAPPAAALPTEAQLEAKRAFEQMVDDLPEPEDSQVRLPGPVFDDGEVIILD